MVKLNRECMTCYHNQRNCSYLLSANCLQNNLCDWEPCTNADYIRNMTTAEMAINLHLPLKWLNERVDIDEQKT